MHHRKELKGRADTYADAKAMEREFIERLKSSVIPDKFVGKQSERLSDLIAQAEEFLWVGKGEGPKNFKKLRYLVDVLGDKPVDEVNTKLVDTLVAQLRKKGPKGRPLEDSSINRYLSALSKFLKWTADHGHRRAPLPKIRWMDEDEGRIRWIEMAEEQKVYDLLPDPYDTVVRVAIRTGMRKGEIYEVVEGLEAQVDADHVHLWKTKNRKARSIPISPETRADILYLRDIGMPSERRLRYEWDKAKAAMGLEQDEDFVFHACRHTFCTRLVQAGVDIRLIKELAGHKSIQTTLRYAHVSRPDLRKAMDKVDALFAPKVLGN